MEVIGESLQPARAPGRSIFSGLLLAAAALLLASLFAALALTGPLAWSVGLIYIAYDSWLLTTMVRLSRRAILEQLRASPTAAAGALPTLAVLIAARNEEAALPQVLDAVLAQDDPPAQLIVIDDGSTDGTLRMLRERYGAVPGDGGSRVTVLAKAHSGKARSLNEALALCTASLVVTLDADTILEPGALRAVREDFARDPELAAGCGVLRPVAQSGGAAPVFELYQTFEYLRSFLWRMAWSRDDTLVLVSGAFAVFRREALLAVGGFDPASHVEDYELLFRLHRRSWEERGKPLRVCVVGAARATTDVPARAGAFLRQRRRWFAGFIETMFKNKDLVGRARYGRLGSFHLLVKTIDTLLPIYGLSAFLALILIVLRGAGIPLLVLAALAGKFVFDFACHVYCLSLHQRWQRQALTARLFTRAALATLTEPYFFQLFRQVGALLGWIAFMRGRVDWAPRGTN